MASEFVRKIKNINNVDLEPFYTSSMGDILLNKQGDAYMHCWNDQEQKEEYKLLTDWDAMWNATSRVFHDKLSNPALNHADGTPDKNVVFKDDKAGNVITYVDLTDEAKKPEGLDVFSWYTKKDSDDYRKKTDHAISQKTAVFHNIKNPKGTEAKLNKADGTNDKNVIFEKDSKTDTISYGYSDKPGNAPTKIFDWYTRPKVDKITQEINNKINPYENTGTNPMILNWQGDVDNENFSEGICSWQLINDMLMLDYSALLLKDLPAYSEASVEFDYTINQKTNPQDIDVTDQIKARLQHNHQYVNYLSVTAGNDVQYSHISQMYFYTPYINLTNYIKLKTMDAITAMSRDNSTMGNDINYHAIIPMLEGNPIHNPNMSDK